MCCLFCRQYLEVSQLIVYSPYKIERFDCLYRECGAKCCTSGRVITSKGIERIAEATGLEPEEFVEGREQRGLFRLRGKGGKCIFLEKDYSCSLHAREAKPIFCQLYPFLFDGIIYSDEVVLKVRAAEECPGIGVGEPLGEDFELKMEALGNRLVSEIEEELEEERR